MEPRIATLLDVQNEDANTQDQVFLVAPPSQIRRPPPAQPMSIGDDGLILTNPLPTDLRSRTRYGAQVSGHSFLARPNPGAPIAQVLNDEEPVYTSLPGTATFISQTAPFSGRLDDLLLDGWEQGNKRRKGDQTVEQSAQPASENNVIKLPELPQLPKKTTRRPRIPPLLQGLHQPPPLPPEGRLFPPITSEKTAFARNPAKPIAFDLPAEESRSKADESRAGARIFASETRSVVQNETGNVEHHAGSQAMPSGSAPESEQNKEAQGKSRIRQSRKRNKWSEQETQDLLLGVSKYGIGSWKKILQDPEFSFKERTAVDWYVKDRFRVCYGDGPKTRKRKQDNMTQEPSSRSNLTPIQAPTVSTSTPECPRSIQGVTEEEQTAEQSSAPTPSKAAAETTDTDTPLSFPKSTRRPQRKFSAKDDENLLIGFEKYGSVWHNMRDDPDLGFGSRHPTDLRDRFRIKYPEKYAKAGYKVKPKKDRPEEEKAGNSNGQQPRMDANYPDTPTRIPYHVGRTPQSEAAARVTPDERHLITPATSSVTPTSSHKPQGIAPYLFDSIPLLLVEDTISEDEDGNEIPITLNRNILQWADANPSTMMAFPSLNTQASTSNPGEAPLHLFEDMHINPLATLQLPSTGSSTATVPTIITHPSILSSSLLAQPADLSASIPASTSPVYPPLADTRPHLNNITSAYAITISNPSSSMNSTGASSGMANSSLDLSRTPNLPTIVYPHVPAASARSAMHNLPKPAALLLGAEAESRGDGVE